ncbi:hypothetical protein ACU686_31465 [Yinghuangia aomiensis]
MMVFTGFDARELGLLKLGARQGRRVQRAPSGDRRPPRLHRRRPVGHAGRAGPPGVERGPPAPVGVRPRAGARSTRRGRAEHRPPTRTPRRRGRPEAEQLSAAAARHCEHVQVGA